MAVGETILLAQSLKITAWLTPIWIFATGAALGYLLILAFLGVINGLGRVAAVNRTVARPAGSIVVGVVTSTVVFAALVSFHVWQTFLVNDVSEFTDDARQRLWTTFGLFVVFALAGSLIVGFGCARLVSQRGLEEANQLTREGFLSWVMNLCTGLTIVAALGLVAGFAPGMLGLPRIVDDPRGMVQSLTRIPFVGRTAREFEIPPTPTTETGTPVRVDFLGAEYRGMLVRANQEIEIASVPIDPLLPSQRIYKVPSTSAEQPVALPKGAVIGNEFIEQLYIANRGANVATVKLEWLLMPVYPEIRVVPWIAAYLAAGFVLLLSGMVLMPKISAISLATFKTEVTQPLYLLVAILGALFVVVSIYIPYNTFGEDIKMYKDSGLTLLRVMAIFVAVWAAGKSVAEEIDGRTALTVLSKPVSRRQFILGKFLGISLAVGLLFLALGLWFIIWVAYKPVYDSVESVQATIEWPECFLAANSMIAPLFLSFLEVVIFVAISVALSTRLHVLPSMVICFSIYVLGHLTSNLVNSSRVVEAFEPVVLFSQIISIVFPVLDHFDMQTAINTGIYVPIDYVGWAVVYTVMYGAMAILLAFVLFEDRDLA